MISRAAARWIPAHTSRRSYAEHTSAPAGEELSHRLLKGAPEIALRLIAPIVVSSTALVFVTGVVLLFVGPAHRNPLLELHKVGFIVWIVFTALHVLGHLPRLGSTLRASARRQTARVGSTPWSTGRWIALAGALVGGLVLALVLIPNFHVWTAQGVLHHHHDG